MLDCCALMRFGARIKLCQIGSEPVLGKLRVLKYILLKLSCADRLRGVNHKKMPFIELDIFNT
jgi:hypothetical protein